MGSWTEAQYERRERPPLVMPRCRSLLVYAFSCSLPPSTPSRNPSCLLVLRAAGVERDAFLRRRAAGRAARSLRLICDRYARYSGSGSQTMGVAKDMTYAHALGSSTEVISSSTPQVSETLTLRSGPFQQRWPLSKSMRG
jgi:hypothetical protein